MLVLLILLSGVGMLVVAHASRQTVRSSLRIALDRAPVAVAVFDAQHRLVFWNQAYAALIGAFGVTLSTRMAFSTIVARVVAGGLSRAYGDEALRAPLRPEWIPSDLIVTPDGRLHEARISQSGDGGFLVMVNDVSEHIAMAVREAEARQLAESASRAKSDFLAHMSHEIRTPLNGILGMAQVMERERLDPSQRQRLGVISDAGRGLLTILNNVLDLSKIEVGKMELNTESFMLSDIIEAAAASHQALAIEKNLSLQTYITEAAQGPWLGDGGRLRQIIANLVSNAVKFTADGGIRVEADLVAQGVQLSVVDTGPGIPIEKAELIFEAFTQADASTTRRFGGTGLGLSISRQLVESMGGALELQAADERGARFIVTLPLPRASEVSPTVIASAATLPALFQRQMRVLAAEDNPMNQLVLKALLQPFDIDLTIAENGREAVDLYGANPLFDIILMDVQMPLLNGPDATREIRTLERSHGLRPTPILAVTANVMTHQVTEYLEARHDRRCPKANRGSGSA